MRSAKLVTQRLNLHIKLWRLKLCGLLNFNVVHNVSTLFSHNFKCMYSSNLYFVYIKLLTQQKLVCAVILTRPYRVKHA